MLPKMHRFAKSYISNGEVTTTISACLMLESFDGRSESVSLMASIGSNRTVGDQVIAHVRFGQKSCFGVTQLDYEIFAFNKSCLTQSFAKQLKTWRSWGRGARPQNAHPAHVLRRLGARDNWPRRRRAAQKRNEFAPLQLSPLKQPSTFRRRPVANRAGQTQKCAAHKTISAICQQRTFHSLTPPVRRDPDEGARTHRKQYLCHTFVQVVGR